MSRLVIDNKLPYIKLPKDKTELFLNWYNTDLRHKLEIPEVFMEGYVELNTESFTEFVSRPIFDLKYKTDLERDIKIKQSLRNTYNNLILYFRFTDKDTIYFEGYSASSGDRLFNYNYSISERNSKQQVAKFIEAIKELSASFTPSNVPDINNEVETNIKLDVNKIKPEAVQETLNGFTKRLCNTCIALSVTSFIYIAMNKSDKYITTDRTVIYNYINPTHKHNKKHKKDRFITTPIYDLEDKRIITLDRLIKRHTGWKITYSFSVRGHYRHYKDGKVVFIESYTKGKKLDNYNNKKLILSPKY